jgi:hypothetical protein
VSTGWKRPLLIALATAPIGLLAIIMIFIVRSEMAFDESRCPYRAREERTFREGTRVREDARTCQDGVEEHRWVLVRDGRPPLELGRRRLASRYYDNYRWSIVEREGRVRVEVHNRGVGPRAYGEPPDAGVTKRR